MAWVITKDNMKTKLIGAGIYSDDAELKDFTKKFVITDQAGNVAYEGVATEDEPAERSVVIHAVGHTFKLKQETRAA